MAGGCYFPRCVVRQKTGEKQLDFCLTTSSSVSVKIMRKEWRLNSDVFVVFRNANCPREGSHARWSICIRAQPS